MEVGLDHRVVIVRAARVGGDEGREAVSSGPDNRQGERFKNK